MVRLTHDRIVRLRRTNAHEQWRPAHVVRTRRETKHLAIVCEPGSYAAQHADEVARDAERALQGTFNC